MFCFKFFTAEKCNDFEYKAKERKNDGEKKKEEASEVYRDMGYYEGFQAIWYNCTISLNRAALGCLILSLGIFIIGADK